MDADTGHVQQGSAPEATNPASGLRTTELIISITNVFNSGQSHDEIIMGVLGTIGEVLQAERMLIFERGDETTRCTFEWCAPGVPSRKHQMQNIPNARFDAMSKLSDPHSKTIASSIEEMHEHDEDIAQRFNRHGVDRVMASPLIDDGEAIGYISANNYQDTEGIDAKRVLDTVAPFVSTKIVYQRLLDELTRAGTHDSLTGVLNRHGIDEAAKQKIASNPRAPFTLILMDIDDFKVVNDLHGHDVGDVALQTLARFIKDAFPADAIIGRNGGDEFVAMLFEPAPGQIEDILQGFFAKPLECKLGGVTYPLSLSAGYVEYPQQSANLQDAYAKADIALYAVKLAGKSGYKKYAQHHEIQYRSQLGFTPRDIAENIPCPIIICSISEVGEILYGNDELFKMFECDSFADFMEYSGGTFEGIVHPDDKESSRKQLRTQSANPNLRGRAYLDFRIVTKTGKTKIIATNSRLVSLPNIGDVSYVLLVDLGERERFRQIRTAPTA